MPFSRMSRDKLTVLVLGLSGECPAMRNARHAKVYKNQLSSTYYFSFAHTFCSLPAHFVPFACTRTLFQLHECISRSCTLARALQLFAVGRWFSSDKNNRLKCALEKVFFLLRHTASSNASILLFSSLALRNIPQLKRIIKYFEFENKQIQWHAFRAEMREPTEMENGKSYGGIGEAPSHRRQLERIVLLRCKANSMADD